MCDMISMNTKTDVLDKLFVEFGGEQRCKVLAYCEAAKLINRMNKDGND